MKMCYKYLVSLIGLIIFCSHWGMGQDGAAIFKQTCVVCHKLGQRLIGPDLLGVNEKRSEEWLLKFIRSSQTMIKSGDPDAVAIFNEYNQIVMNDQSFLSDDEIRAVLFYIKEETSSLGVKAQSEEKTEEVEIIPIEYTVEDIQSGLQLFSGKKSLVHGGPSCISCHHINNNQLLSGGVFAKDLTNVYGRMGDTGLAGILSAPPFPAMATAYMNYALDSAEIVQLTAFLKQADIVSKGQEVKSGARILILGGGGGLILLFLLIAFHWNNRLKASVKHDIFKRQIKSI